MFLILVFNYFYPLTLSTSNPNQQYEPELKVSKRHTHGFKERFNQIIVLHIHKLFLVLSQKLDNYNITYV